MPNLKDKLKESLTQSRINRNKLDLTFFQTFLGELEQTQKGTSKKADTNTLIQKQAKAWKKNLTVTYNVAYENSRAEIMTATVAELHLLEPYLPVYSLTGETLYNVIRSIVVNLDDAKFGVVMKTLGSNHKGLYDAVEAKEVVKDVIESEGIL